GAGETEAMFGAGGAAEGAVERGGGATTTARASGAGAGWTLPEHAAHQAATRRTDCDRWWARQFTGCRNFAPNRAASQVPGALRSRACRREWETAPGRAWT